MKQSAPMEVGISVVDMDRMLDFYTSVLSCAEERRADIPAELTRALTSGEGGYLAVWLRTPGGEVIKLFRTPEAPASLAAPDQLTARTGDRLRHLLLLGPDSNPCRCRGERRGPALGPQADCRRSSAKAVLFR